MRLRFLPSFLAGGLSLLTLTTQSHAATLTVFNTNDSGSGSLRQAIADANTETTFPGPDTIQFAPEVRGSIVLATSLPEVSSTIDVQGPGAQLLALSGGGNTRHFTIASGASATISGLTLRDGLAPDSGNGDTSGTRSGGSIYNLGTLVLSKCLLERNRAVGLPLPSNAPYGTLPNFGRGGAIVNAGSLTLRGCTLSNNLAQGGEGGGVGTGGAILSGSTSSHSLTVENSTFAGNTARGTAPSKFGTLDGYSRGGAITVSGGTASLLHTTIVGNLSQTGAATVSGEGGGVVVGNATATAQNTVIAGNASRKGDTENGYGPDVSGTLGGNYNLIGQGSGATLSGTNNKVNVADAKVGTLALNGGDTPTIALLPGSPAINAADPRYAHIQSQDQRDSPRPQVGRADIGAFELEFTPNESLVVSTLTDEDDGTSDPAFGTGTSLREAIRFANSAPDANTILFDAGVFNGPKTISLQLSTLYINAPLTIASPSAGTLTIERSSAPATPVFGILAVGSGVSPVTLDGLVISGGQGENGSGVVNKGTLSLLNCRLTNSQCQGSGGGLKNYGTVTLRSCTVAGNSSGIYGGGIINSEGTTSLFDCTISGNTAMGNGGGLMNFSGTTSLVNCTIADNKSFHSGGGIANGGTLDLRNCTVVGNDATNVAGGILTSAPSGSSTTVAEHAFLANTLVALNTQGNSNPTVLGEVLGQFRSQNYNFIGTADNATGFSGTGDQTGTTASPLNAQLETSEGKPLLKDNGGATQTVRLLQGSAAINAGDPAFDATSLPYDQRGEGYLRVRGERLDVGAFEEQEPVFVAPVLTRVTIDNTSPKTNDTLTATPVVAQGNPGTLTFSYTWKKNGVVIQGAAGNALNLATTGNGDKGDSITCTVIATNGTAQSEPVTSGAIKVQNSAPVLSQAVFLENIPVRTNDNPGVHFDSVFDPDGDRILWTYQWRKNGQILVGETGSRLSLRTPGNGDKGDQISGTVIATDGTDSASSSTPPATIVNSAPVIEVILQPRGGFTNVLLKAEPHTYDADNDELSITYRWKKNGILLPETGPTLDTSKPGNGDKGDVISVVGIANDGQLTGENYIQYAIISNCPPVLASRSITATENTTLSGKLVGQDLDGDVLTYSVAYNTQHGKLVLGLNGAFTYTPNPNWNGTDIFQARATDTSRASTTGAISIIVRPVNGRPVALGDVVKGLEDTPLTIAAATLLRNDSNGERVGEADALRIVKVAQPAGFPGALRLDVAKQTILFAPKLNWSGTTSFTYAVQDSKGATATAQVTLLIAPVNDAPVALPGRLTVLSGTLGELPLAGSDVEGSPLTFGLSTKPSNGVAGVFKVGDKWMLRYQSKVGFTGTDTLSVVARDGKLNSLPATITITVTPNSAPTLVSLLPSRGRFASGSTVVFEQKVRDLNGTAHLDATALLIGNLPTAANARGGATLWFDAILNQFTLTKDDGASTFAPVALGGTLENSQVKVTLGAGDALRDKYGILTLKWRVTFKPAFAGTKSLWMRVEDLGGLSAGFTKSGDITLTPPASATLAGSSAGSS